jgi:hypothetical protein
LNKPQLLILGSSGLNLDCFRKFIFCDTTSENQKFSGITNYKGEIKMKNNKNKYMVGIASVVTLALGGINLYAKNCKFYDAIPHDYFSTTMEPLATDVADPEWVDNNGRPIRPLNSFNSLNDPIEYLSQRKNAFDQIPAIDDACRDHYLSVFHYAAPRRLRSLIKEYDEKNCYSERGGINIATLDPRVADKVLSTDGFSDKQKECVDFAFEFLALNEELSASQRVQFGSSAFVDSSKGGVSGEKTVK